jgi:hypothetical protein
VGEGAAEVVAAGTSRVVARSVISLRVLVLAAAAAVEHGGTPLPPMPSQTGHMLKGEANTAVVDEVEGTADTHLHGLTRVKVEATLSACVLLFLLATMMTMSDVIDLK